MRFAVRAAAGLLFAGAAHPADDIAAAYARAAEFVPWRVHTFLTQHEAQSARWAVDGREFTYVVRGPQGANRVRGDARTGKLRPAPTAPESPSITFDPAGKRGIGLTNYNLWLKEGGGGAPAALTTDGTRDNAYGALFEFGVLLESERASLTGPMRAAQGIWSPDGRWFATFRYDQRGVGKQTYWVAVTEEGYGKRPRFVDQPSPYPGDAKNAVATLILVDIEQRMVRSIDAATFETFLDPVDSKLMHWSADSRSLYYLQEGRGLRSVDVRRVDVANGAIEDLYRETSDTYLMLSGTRYPAIWQVSGDGRRLLWYSERDGWGNLYDIDLRGGAARPLTSGPGVVTKLLRIDERAGWVYFLACGRSADLDPYFRQAWRARLDGSRVELLTPGNADHVVSMPARGSSFLDISTAGVAGAPRVELRSLDGKMLARVADTDLAPLRARGWRGPERVKLRSADDRYDIYATVFRPTSFDPARKYPVLDYIYGIASLARTPWSFPLGAGYEMADSYWHSQAIAELGFIVIKVDSPGTPLRGRRFARESYGAAHVGAMLDSHIAAARQLAARDPSFDLDRMGIFGSSGGGFTSARALLLHPEFYKVAVAFSGAHDLLRLYGPEWGERYIGPYASNRETYDRLSNTAFAERLRGKLLLVHGEADSEVTISHTQQFVHALIAANRDFDLLYVPNMEHDMDSNPYAVRRRWDYFVENLAGLAPPPQFPMPGPAD